jgi:iron complex transport system permease protein
MQKSHNGTGRGRFGTWMILSLLTVLVFLLCICAGSVTVPLKDTLQVLFGTSVNRAAEKIVLAVRLPRVLCAALVGASLSLCGAAMQGLLKNPLADGYTLGISSGASLGAILAFLFQISFESLPFSGTMVMASLFAFLSLLVILGLAYHVDRSLSTNTIILIGIFFSMFVSALSSLLITFAGEKIRSITFWTLGSLSGSTLANAAALGGTLLVCGTILIGQSRELNTFAIGEDNARSIGVNVRKSRLLVLGASSVLIGVSVSVSGTIGFVGLVIPHILRLIVGPNHRKLLPACIFGGMCFLMLADLAARTIIRPVELPIGVVTSFIGAVVFVVIFCHSRRAAV